MIYQPPIAEERKRLSEPPPLPPTGQIETNSGDPLTLERLGVISETSDTTPLVQGEIISIEEGEYVSVEVPSVSPDETVYEEVIYTVGADTLLRIVEGDSALEEETREITEAIYGQPLQETSTVFGPVPESVFLQPGATLEG